MKENLPAPKKALKKRTLALLLACVTVLILAVPAFACGHGHHSSKRIRSQVTVCPVADCETPGRHVHSGVTYCGYDHEDGICDGKCLPLCSAEGCTVTGRHTHDGVTYCGEHHEEGFCAGTCASGGHHSGHHHR